MSQGAGLLVDLEEDLGLSNLATKNDRCDAGPTARPRKLLQRQPRRCSLQPRTFRPSENIDRSQIARATITLPRKKSNGKLNTPKHTATHLLLTEKDEKWTTGIVYVETTHDGPRLFIARNDTERNWVSL